MSHSFDAKEFAAACVPFESGTRNREIPVSDNKKEAIKPLNLKTIRDLLYIGNEHSRPLLAPIPPERFESKDFHFYSYRCNRRWYREQAFGEIDVHFSQEELDALDKALTPLYTDHSDAGFLCQHFFTAQEPLKNFFTEDHRAALDALLRGQCADNRDALRAQDLLLGYLLCRNALRDLVLTQFQILAQYDYDPPVWREALLRLVDEAIAGALDGTRAVLRQLRLALLYFLSRGSDAAALTGLLLYAIFQERAAVPLKLLMEASDVECYSIPDPGTQETTDLGGGYYVTFNEMDNHIGGYAQRNITLWKTPGVMINKLSDVLGFFFYPVRDENGVKLNGKSMDFVAEATRLDEETFLLRWMVQPDGRYYADEDGFGAEHDEEIVLYARFDKRGRFIEPFSPRRPE